MLARYRIVRGKRPPGDPLPDGVRIDVRKHRRHVLSPEPAMVERFLEDAADEARAAEFSRSYRALLEARFAADPAPFEALARQSREGDVYLGCSCPTKKQPEVARCHTVLALQFMAERFDDLEVVAGSSVDRHP